MVSYMKKSLEKIKLTKLCVRLDDYHETSNHKHWKCIIDVCLINNFDIFIGVIPANNDMALKRQGNKKDFVENLRYFNSYPKIKLMMHGYNHLIVNGKCEWKLSKRGEFFGEKENVICAKLKAGEDFFIQHNLYLHGYFAPAHGYSSLLLEVLRKNYSDWLIADNYYRKPLFDNKLLIIPQNFNRFYFISKYIGFSLACFHPEDWKEEDTANFKQHLELYSKYNEDTEFLISDKTFFDQAFNILIRILKKLARLKKYS